MIVMAYFCRQKEKMKAVALTITRTNDVLLASVRQR
jgi:hypothetical protein